MLYRAAYVLPMDGEVVRYGEVLVRDREISAVGKNLASQYPGEPITDLGNCVLLPGFVNSHCHLDYTFARNTVDGKNLWEWLESVAFNRSRKPDEQVVRLSAILGAGELALAGVTCVGDSSFTGLAADALESVGLRGVVYLEVFGQSAGVDYARLFEQKLSQVRELQKRCSKLIRVGISPHSVYTSNREILELCAQAVSDYGLPVSIHVAETWAEAEYLIGGTGPIAELRRRMGYEPMVARMRPVEYVRQIELLRPGVCLAHCVDLTRGEVELIATSGAGVAHCARSNAFLGCGIAPVSQLVQLGGKVGLGTDGAGTCGTLDFFEEMRFALALQRAHVKEASVLYARDVLKMATIGGACVLGLENQVGTLEPGKSADLIAIDISDSLSTEDIWLAVLSCKPEDVRLVVVGGVEVVRSGRLVNVELAEVKAELEERLHFE